MMFVFIVLCFLLYISSVAFRSSSIINRTCFTYCFFLFFSFAPSLCFPFNFLLSLSLCFSPDIVECQVRFVHFIETQNERVTEWERKKTKQTFKSPKLWNGAKCTSRWVLVTYYRYISLTLNTVTINVLFSHIFHLKNKTKLGRILCGAPSFKRYFICSFRSVFFLCTP